MSTENTGWPTMADLQKQAEEFAVTPKWAAAKTVTRVAVTVVAAIAVTTVIVRSAGALSDCVFGAHD
jgi:hypothetical protein